MVACSLFCVHNVGWRSRAYRSSGSCNWYVGYTLFLVSLHNSLVTILWLCQVNNLEFWISGWLLLTWGSHEGVQWSKDPFPFKKVISGHENIKSNYSIYCVWSCISILLLPCAYILLIAGIDSATSQYACIWYKCPAGERYNKANIRPITGSTFSSGECADSC